MMKLKEGVRAVMERTHLKGTRGRIVRESSAFAPMEQTADTCALLEETKQGLSHAIRMPLQTLF